MSLKNFIANNFVDTLDASRGSVDVVAPATGVVVARVPVSSRDDLDQAVRAAQQAFHSWSQTTLKQRTTLCFKLKELIDKHADELAELIVLENGKNKAEALADIAKGNETTEWATSLPDRASGRVLEVSRGITCQDLRKPLGVVAAIVPFNFPLMVPFWTIPISLTMGNCVILKPSEKVPSTMMRVCELMIQAGYPPGVFQIVHGTADVVTGMCDHPDIAAVTFVGSSNVAQIVANRCRAVNKRFLALGGAKNHLVALDDCDISMASRDIVASAFGCAGQRCMAASVLLIVGTGSAQTSLLSEIVDAASKLVPGQAAGQIGPVIDAASKAKIIRYITESEQGGAQILLDGRTWAETKTQGNWVGPTVILHTNKADAALHDEIFGPVLSVYVCSDWEEAIEIENANPYGNAASIYTERGANAEWFTSRFRAAMLGVNIGIPVPREPFSFGGLYGTRSKFGDVDITGDAAMDFFSNRIKVTSKWSSSYSATGKRAREAEASSSSSSSASSSASTFVDKASFDGKI